jgi:ABC-type multidrug transport system ATPase subunit
MMGKRSVLRGLDLLIIEGECVVLRGDNGSGKTTLLRCLAGLARPEEGRVRWFEHLPLETSARRLIGMVAHESHLYRHLTLCENLVLAARLQSLDEPAQRAARWLDAAGLKRFADRLPEEVSQGMRLRTSLARALLHDPPILLLDEPFSGLDPAGKEWLGQTLLERRIQGQTTCLVSHEHPTTDRLVSRTLELRAGRLRRSDGPEPAQDPGVIDSMSVDPRLSLDQVAA